MSIAGSGAPHAGTHAGKVGSEALDRLIAAGSALWAQAVDLVMAQPLLGWALVSAGVLIFGNLLRYRLPLLGGFLRFIGNLGLIMALILAFLGLVDMRRFGVNIPLPDSLSHYLPRTEEPEVISGKDTRIPLASDGHFWVHVTINGVSRRFLVDTGATLTTLSPQTAEEMGLDIHGGPKIELHTANGNAPGRIVRIPELQVGNAVARNIDAVVAPGLGGTNVLGMNFLTKLKGWRVEDRVMVLEPHHPVASKDEG